MHPSAEKPLDGLPFREGLQPKAGGSPDAILSTARRSLTDWSEVPLPNRLRVVRKFRQLLATESEEIAHSLATASARSAAEVLTSEILPLLAACRFLERQAEHLLAPRRLGSKGRPLWLIGSQSVVCREPWGVVLVIAPSNYPIFLPSVQLVQALAAGNSVLLKPGVGGAAPALYLARLLDDAGLPAGVLTVLSEEPEMTTALLKLGVDKVIFTGSAEVGKRVLGQLTEHTTPSVFELSGCDAVIVRADADLDLAARSVAFGLQLNSGRTCIAPKRIYVARSVSTEFEGRLARVLSQRAAIQLPESLSHRVMPFLAHALGSGAHVLCGALRPPAEIAAPLILGGVPISSALLKEDFFAPIAVVVTVSDDEEAVRLANDCAYGLGASVFTRNAERATRIAGQLKVGVVVINDMIVPTADPRVPFGGRSGSGFGVTRGAEGLLEMTVPKVISARRRFYSHLELPGREDAQLFGAFVRFSHGTGFFLRLRALFKFVALAIGRNPAVVPHQQSRS